jgi:hypothetical protein
VTAGAVLGAAGALAARRAVTGVIQRRHHEEPLDARADVAGETAEVAGETTSIPAGGTNGPAPQTDPDPDDSADWPHTCRTNGTARTDATAMFALTLR